MIEILPDDIEVSGGVGGSEGKNIKPKLCVKKKEDLSDFNFKTKLVKTEYIDFDAEE